MPFLQELMGGGQQKPTAQEMAGGIAQNADPGKGGMPSLALTGRFLKDFFNPTALPGDDIYKSGASGAPPPNLTPDQPPGSREGVLGLGGNVGGGRYQPPPVQATPAPDMSNIPAQMMPEQAVAPAATPPAIGATGGPPMGAGAMPMGQPPQMQGNPALLQALMARQQGAR